jgi:uncharacterized damage-inducible protein DinB
MLGIRNIQMLTQYAKWANQTLFDALKMLPNEEVIKERKTGAGSLLKTLSHIYAIDQIWKGHLLGQNHGYHTRNLLEIPSLDQLTTMQSVSDNWYIDYANTLTPQMHDESLVFAFVDGGKGEMTRGDMLLHVMNHKTYHRGYVAQMMYESSYRPPVIDLPVFLRDAFIKPN